MEQLKLEEVKEECLRSSRDLRWTSERLNMLSAHLSYKRSAQTHALD